MSDTDSRTRAAAAERILEDRVFDEAVQAVYSDYFTQIVKSEPHETEKREDAYRHLRALFRVKAKLNSYLADGQLAQRQIVEAKKLRAI